MNRPRREPLRVVLLGLGSVGSEVCRELLERPAELAAQAGGREFCLIGIGVRDPRRARAIELPASVDVSSDPIQLARRPGVDVVVELMGGLEPAGAVISGALEAGRPVVTANKALLAERGLDLEAVARRSGAALRFEAAVGGGIPILGPLAADLAANRWSSLRGIVNGSTNLILERMTESGLTLEAAVAAAQGQGILEADPAADLDGRDAAAKLAILIRLAFGSWPDVGRIVRGSPLGGALAGPGIRGVTPEIIAAARRAGRVVKLVAEARRRADGAPGQIEAGVRMIELEADDPLAGVKGTDNRIELEGQPIGRVAFSGPGAGGRPTSSAVLGDLLALARGEGSTWAGLAPATALTVDTVP